MKHTDETVIGYAPQPTHKVALVNQNKVLEGYIMDQIAKLLDHARISPDDVDGRMTALAKTNIEQGFMWLNRAIFQPKQKTQTPPPMPVTTPKFDSNGDWVERLRLRKPLPYESVPDDREEEDAINREEEGVDQENAEQVAFDLDDPLSDADKLANAEHDRRAR